MPAVGGDDKLGKGLEAIVRCKSVLSARTFGQAICGKNDVSTLDCMRRKSWCAPGNSRRRASPRLKGPTCWCLLGRLLSAFLVKPPSSHDNLCPSALAQAESRIRTNSLCWLRLDCWHRRYRPGCSVAVHEKSTFGDYRENPCNVCWTSRPLSPADHTLGPPGRFLLAGVPKTWFNLI